MIEFSLTHTDLARIRFAHSPAWELMTSVRVLQDRKHQFMYRRWLDMVRARLDGIDMELLLALMPVEACVPDFLTPSPEGMHGRLSDELAIIAETDPRVVRQELSPLMEQRRAPVLEKLYDDPARHLGKVVGSMARYWEVAIEPVWPQIRSLAMADVEYRLERIAAGGISHMLSGVNSDLTFEDDRLLLRRPGHTRPLDVGGRGVVLLPGSFVWPNVIYLQSSTYQPTLCYTLRGVTGLCDASPAEHSSLHRLLGQTRANLLSMLEHPWTTTELASRLSITPSAISQHLKILSESAMVIRRRRGKLVFYQRTPAASSLLASPCLLDELNATPYHASEDDSQERASSKIGAASPFA